MAPEPRLRHVRSYSRKKSKAIDVLKMHNSRIYLKNAYSLWERERRKWSEHLFSEGHTTTYISNEQFAFHLLMTLRDSRSCKCNKRITLKAKHQPKTYASIINHVESHERKQEKRKLQSARDDNVIDKKGRMKMKSDLLSMMIEATELDEVTTKFINKQLDPCIEALRGPVLEQRPKAVNVVPVSLTPDCALQSTTEMILGFPTFDSLVENATETTVEKSTRKFKRRKTSAKDNGKITANATPVSFTPTNECLSVADLSVTSNLSILPSTEESIVLNISDGSQSAISTRTS